MKYNLVLALFSKQSVSYKDALTRDHYKTAKSGGEQILNQLTNVHSEEYPSREMRQTMKEIPKSK